MKWFASLTVLLSAYAFFLLFNHVNGWVLLGASGHFSAWQRQMADWWLAGP